MDDFLAARAQMAMSLGFHIIFSCVGMVMPFLMAFAHWKYLKTKNEVYKGLTKHGARVLQSFLLPELFPERCFPLNWDFCGLNL
jgi:cytochrome bd-type quinol oxidase subunit 1